MRSVATCLLLAGMIALPAAAHADPMDLFTINFEGTTISYALPASPDPGLPINGDLFEIEVTATLPDGTNVPDLVGFFTSDNMGGLLDTYLGISPDGFDDQQYFTGPVTAPTFITGTYTLLDPIVLQPEGFLTISSYSGPNPPDAPISIDTAPEPSSLLLLGTGIGALALVARRRGMSLAVPGQSGGGFAN